MTISQWMMTRWPRTHFAFGSDALWERSPSGATWSSRSDRAILIIFSLKKTRWRWGVNGGAKKHYFFLNRHGDSDDAFMLHLAENVLLGGRRIFTNSDELYWHCMGLYYCLRVMHHSLFTWYLKCILIGMSAQGPFSTLNMSIC